MKRKTHYKVKWNWQMDGNAWFGISLIWFMCALGAMIPTIVAYDEPHHRHPFHHPLFIFMFCFWLGIPVLLALGAVTRWLIHHPPITIEKVEHYTVMRSRLEELEARTKELEREAGLHS